MKPKDFISLHGIGYFTANKGKTLTVRLLSDDGLVISGYYLGITPIGNELPLIDGLLIEIPQFNIHLLYTDPQDGRIVPVKFNLMLVDDMNDIKFIEEQK